MKTAPVKTGPAKTGRFLVPAFAALAIAGCHKQADTGTSAPAASTASAPAAPAPAGGWVEQVVRTPDGGYLMGNPNAAVKLIEYGSRLCPFCAKFDGEGLPALKTGPIAQGKLSYEFRDYPVHGAADLAPIVLGHCVDTPVFFPLLDHMMSNQQAIMKDEATENALFKNVMAMQQANATPAQIATAFAEKSGYLTFVQQRGIPDAKARACLSDPKAYDAIAKNAVAAGQQFQLTGTPTFIINGQVAQGVNDWAQLQPALKAAGA